MAAARTKTLVVSLATAMVTLLAVGGYLFYAPRRVPGGQAELVYLDAGNIDTLRADFNRAAGGTRLIVLLSPT